jgi:hypothetical protein
MVNSVLPTTIREFAEDMIEQYDRLKREGKSPMEIFEFAASFFNGLADGRIAILKNVDEKAVIQGFACIIDDQFKRLSANGNTPEEILLSVRYYLIGTIDGIDLSEERPLSRNRH